MQPSEKTNQDLRNIAAKAIDAVAPTDEKQARDWAGFFAALAQFVTVLAPIVIPLFMSTDPKPEPTK